MNGSPRGVRRIIRINCFPLCVLDSADTWNNRAPKRHKTVNSFHCDALVFFGATGDLAFKKIFPALQAMIKRGNLTVPVIGVARSAPDLPALKARARASLEANGGL